MLVIDWASSATACHRATFERGVVGIRCQIETWTGAQIPDNVDVTHDTHNKRTSHELEHTTQTLSGSHPTQHTHETLHTAALQGRHTFQAPSRIEWGTLASLMPALTGPRYKLTREDLSDNNFAPDPDFDSDTYIEVRKELNHCCPVQLFGYSRQTLAQGARA